MADIDNSFKYSNTISIRNTGSVTFTIYPNPVRGTLVVNLDAVKTEAAEVSITDFNGRKVYSHHENVTQGNNNIRVDVNNFSKGTYYIKIGLSNASYTGKFDKL
jgi:hypothetical protein